MAKQEKPEKQGKKKGKGEDGGKRKRDPRAEPAPYSSIATHPRASQSVRRAKAWTGLAAFVISGLLALQAGVPLIQIGVRALAAGIVGYLLGWWVAMLVWRQLMLAEQRVAVEEIERRRAEAEAEAEPKAAALAGSAQQQKPGSKTL